MKEKIYDFFKKDWKKTKEETKESLKSKREWKELRELLMGLLIFFIIVGVIGYLVDWIGSTIVPSLKDYSESQERKDVYKFMCSRTESFSDFCYYNELNKMWGYTVIPKTEQEIGKTEEKFFTSEKECIDFCYKDWMKTEKSLNEKLISKEMVEDAQESFPELQKSFWYKLSNWLKKI